MKSAAWEVVTTATPAEPVNLHRTALGFLLNPSTQRTHPDSHARLLSHSPTYLRVGISFHRGSPRTTLTRSRAHLPSVRYCTPSAAAPLTQCENSLSVQSLLLHQRTKLGELGRCVLGRAGRRGLLREELLLEERRTLWSGEAGRQERS